MNEPDSSTLPPADESDPAEPRVGPDFDFTDPNSRLAPYYLQTSHVLAILVVMAIFLFYNFNPLGHTDIWGHIKLGEWIVQNQRLPEREPFSPHSDPTLPASNFAWLTQVMLYGTFRLGAWLAGGGPLQQTEGGVDLLRFLHGLCQAAKATFLLLAFRRCTRSLPLAIGGVVIVFVLTLAPSGVQRPQSFAEVLFALLLWLLIRPLTAGVAEPSISWRCTWGVGGLLVLWANVHGSFLVGFVLVALFWLGGVLESLRDRGFGATLRTTALHRPLLALVVGFVAMSFANPHGWRAIPEVFAFAQLPPVRTMTEWQPMAFSRGPGGHWGYLAILILIALTQLASPRVFQPTPLLLLATFGLGPLVQERLMTWWCMLVPIILLPVWADLVVVGPETAARWTSVLSLRKTIIAAGIVIVGLVWTNLFQLLLGHEPTPLPVAVAPATLWPVTDDVLHGRAAAAAGDNQKLADNPLAQALATSLKTYPNGQFRGAIFVPEAMGDYLVWSLPAYAPVTVYSHVHVFPTRYWDDYREVLFGRPGWKTVLDRNDVNLVIAPIEQCRELFEKLKADPNWTVILEPTTETRHRSHRLFAVLRKTPLR